MDLVEIDYHDYLAERACGIRQDFTDWFTYDWEHHVMSFSQPSGYMDERIFIDDIQLRVGDDIISLSDGVYEIEPYTDISTNFGGRLTTLAMLATIFVKDAKVTGKMSIYNAFKPSIETNYELVLNRAELQQLVGLKIRGDAWIFDNCKYKLVKSDLSFEYFDNSKKISVFDRETDSNKRKLLKQYMLEYITKELGPALEYYQLCQLHLKSLASDNVGSDHRLKNMLSIHNKIMRKAFKNLSEKIISIANSQLVKRSPKLKFTELLGLTEQKNKELNLRMYSGYIDKLDSLTFHQKKNTIISNKDDLVIVHVPVEFQGLKLYIEDGSPTEPKEQTYETSGSHFIMSLKRLSDNEAKISLVNFKVLNIKPTSETPIHVPMDHLITFAIEQHVKPFLEEAMMKRELQELAIKPEVEIEYDTDDDLMYEDSENEL